MQDPAQDTKSEPLSGVRERFPELYFELRGVAERMLAARPPHNLTPTELSHEAFTKLCAEEAKRRAAERSELGEKPDATFKACFGAACRDVLVAQQRKDDTEKRGGDVMHEPLRSSIAFDGDQWFDVLALHDALGELAQLDRLLADLAEARLFGGLLLDECATLLEIPKRTLERRWAFAGAWLRERLA